MVVLKTFHDMSIHIDIEWCQEGKTDGINNVTPLEHRN